LTKQETYLTTRNKTNKKPFHQLKQTIYKTMNQPTNYWLTFELVKLHEMKNFLFVSILFAGTILTKPASADNKPVVQSFKPMLASYNEANCQQIITNRTTTKRDTLVVQKTKPNCVKPKVADPEIPNNNSKKYQLL
jgi:hypothetical protein